MSVVTLINRADEVLEGYGVYPNIGSLRTVTRYSICLLSVLTDINRQLRVCRQELEKGVVTEPFPFSFWKNEKHRYLKGSAMEKDLIDHGSKTLESMRINFSIEGRDIKEIKDFYCALNAEYEEMNDHLRAIQELTLSLSPEAYANYYHTRKVELDEETVRKKYLKMKMDLMPITPQKLKILQTQVVANALIAGIMDHADDTTPLDYQDVNVEKVKAYLPDYYKDILPGDFDTRCAKYHRHVSWSDDDKILYIDYNSLGYSLYKHSDKITPQQFIAIYEHDMMLFWVHQEMMAQSKNPAEQEDSQDVNLFAPGMGIKKMFQQDWFVELRSDNKYHKTWGEQFADDFMASEWGEPYAKEWRVKSKRLKVECKLAGALKDAGVIKGSYAKIASFINQDELKEDSLANYMGMGKDEPYYDWICEYVAG